MLYPVFKSINPVTRIGVSNLKDEIEKSTLAKFSNNVKDLLDDLPSNYSMIIYKVEYHEDYGRHVFRVILSGPNSNSNCFSERTKVDWYTGTEVLTGYLIHNTTYKYNNMVS